MKILLIITMIAGLTTFNASAKDCGEPDTKHWTTVINLKAKPVTLNWTGVYEGQNSVCGLTYESTSGKQVAIDIFGQPFVNNSKSLIAFLSCADDGCSNEISVYDIERGETLKSKLPIAASQFYLKAKSNDSEHELFVDVESFSHGKALPLIRFVCLASDKLQCSNNKN